MFPATPVRPSPDRRLLSRRTTVAAAAGALLASGLAGCTTDTAPRAAGPGQLPASVDTDGDPDARLLADVLGSIDEVVAVVSAVRRRDRSQRVRLAALLDLHAAHRDLLTEATGDTHPPSTRSADLPRGRGAALALVERRERLLADRLAAVAVEAESGTFARALASMAAGIRQHLAVSPVGVR